MLDIVKGPNYRFRKMNGPMTGEEGRPVCSIVDFIQIIVVINSLRQALKLIDYNISFGLSKTNYNTL